MKKPYERIILGQTQGLCLLKATLVGGPHDKKVVATSGDTIVFQGDVYRYRESDDGYHHCPNERIDEWDFEVNCNSPIMPQLAFYRGIFHTGVPIEEGDYGLQFYVQHARSAIEQFLKKGKPQKEADMLRCLGLTPDSISERDKIDLREALPKPFQNYWHRIYFDEFSTYHAEFRPRFHS